MAFDSNLLRHVHRIPVHVSGSRILTDNCLFHLHGLYKHITFQITREQIHADNGTCQGVAGMYYGDVQQTVTYGGVGGDICVVAVL